MPRKSDFGSLNCRTFAWILDAEEGHQYLDFTHHAQPFGLDQHARQGHVHRHVRDGRANAGQPVLCIDRTDFKKTPIAITDGAFLRGIDEGEFRDIAQLQRQHAQDHAGQ